MTSTLCQYETTGTITDGKWPYRCRQCRHERTSKYPPEMLRRLCVVGRRRSVETDLQQMVDAGAATRTMEEIQTTLDKCFGGCREFNGSYCTRRGSPCQHRKNWLLWLVVSDCDRYP